MKIQDLTIEVHLGVNESTSFKLSKEDNEFLNKEAKELQEDGIAKGAKGMVLRQLVANARKEKAVNLKKAL